MSKTTRKDVMRKSVEGKTGKELLDLCAKYFNELASGYFFEYEVVHYDETSNCYREEEKPEENFYSNVDDFCGEISYWLSCYYEGGNVRHDDEYKDRFAFIKFLEIFKPFCSENHTKWIPRKPETEFLF